MSGFETPAAIRKKGYGRAAHDGENPAGVSRRTFLKAAGASAAAMMAGPTLHDYMVEAVSGKELLESIAEKQRQIKEIYGIDAGYFHAKARALLSEKSISYHARHPDVSEETLGKWQARLRKEYPAS